VLITIAPGERANWSETVKSGSGVAGGVDETLELPEKSSSIASRSSVSSSNRQRRFFAKMVARVSNHTVAHADAFCRSNRQRLKCLDWSLEMLVLQKITIA
jgi:hypothetical protein